MPVANGSGSTVSSQAIHQLVFIILLILKAENYTTES